MRKRFTIRNHNGKADSFLPTKKPLIIKMLQNDQRLHKIYDAQAIKPTTLKGHIAFTTPYQDRHVA